MGNSQFDSTSDPDPSGNSDGSRDDESAIRPFLGIQFECCRTYGRIYRNKAGSHYEGRCPRCFKRLEIPIGGGGTNNRFFRAS